jgi:DNA-binding NarL/FixJ family response regulator
MQGVEMALHTLNFWEIAIDATQIGPSGEESKKFNTEFVVEAVRQQTELAFNHILETIDKERQTLDAYFELRETQLAPGLLKSVSSGRVEPISSSEASEPDAADTIYSEIESLSDQGLSLADIAEKLNVPRGEVDLVLKLKRLSIESANLKDNPQ